MRVASRLIVAALCIASTDVTARDLDDSLNQILSRPVSPGALGLLLFYARDPNAQARWIDSLRDADPHVRATAARMLHVSTVRSALPALTEALAKESDLSVAREIAKGMIALGAANEDEAVLKAARKLSCNSLVVNIAEARGQNGLTELPAMVPFDLSAGDADSVVSALTAHEATALDRAAQAVLGAPTVSPAWWEGVLGVAARNHVVLEASRLEAALATTSPAVHESTWWYVALIAGDGRNLGKLSSSPQPVEPSLTPEAAFGRELAARALKVRATPQPAFEAKARRGAELTVPAFARLEFAGGLYPLLSKSEREALDIQSRRKEHLPAEAKGETPSGAIAAIRTVSGLPDGYAADVLKVTGCQAPDSGDIAGPVVRFEGNSIKDLKWAATRLTTDCDAAARLITSAAMLPEEAMAPGKLELIALPMHRAFLECLSQVEAPGQYPGGLHVGQRNIKPPTKIRHVAPEYPQNAQAERRQGIVIVESWITSRGCVGSAKVLRSVATDLDVAALRAVTGWAFTPTLVDGTPVPVIMTVTVQFSLR